ncbi:hypothetical protein D3C73_1023560 [compost metagenome]
MAYVVNLPYNTALKKHLRNCLITLPDVLAFPLGFCIVAILVNNMDYRDIFTLRHFKVFFAVCRRDMNDTRTIFNADILSVPDFMGILATVNTK